MNGERIVLRVIGRDKEGGVISIIEQEVPATDREVALFLRRLPCRSSVASALLGSGTVTIERKAKS